MNHFRLGARVRVYRNLNAGKDANKRWSIMDKATRRVIAHGSQVVLGSNVTTVISEAGRARVLKTGRKNVHAFLEGNLHAIGSEFCHLLSPFLTEDLRRLRQMIYYDPRLDVDEPPTFRDLRTRAPARGPWFTVVLGERVEVFH